MESKWFPGLISKKNVESTVPNCEDFDFKRVRELICKFISSEDGDVSILIDYLKGLIKL